MRRSDYVTIGVMAVAALLTGCKREEPAPFPAARSIALPQAGMTLTLPAGFIRQSLGEEFQLLRAARFADDVPVQGLTVLAFPVMAGTTADQFAEEMLADMQQQLAFRGIEELGGGPAELAGSLGHRRVVDYVHRGQSATAAWVIAVRPMTEDLSICYVLWVESPTDRSEEVEPTLEEVVASVTLGEVTSAAEGGITAVYERHVLADAGCAIRRPARWFAVASVDRVEMGQIDFTRGGVVSPVARLQAEETTETESMSCSQKSLVLARQMAHQIGDNVEVVHQGPADLGDYDSFEFVLVCTPLSQPTTDEAATAPAEDVLPTPVCIAQRALCLPPDESGVSRSYYLTLICETDSVEAVRAMMEKLAGGFELLDEPAAESPSE